MIFHLPSLAIAVGILAVPLDAASSSGEINCRYEATTPSEVNYYTCHELATKYSITIEKFFQLNPAVDKDCNTIKPGTVYCVAGCRYFQKTYVNYLNTWQLFSSQFPKTDFVGPSMEMPPVLVPTSNVVMERPGNAETSCRRPPLNIC
jgi:hypothetical protein